jgi:hypothetical protein
MISGILLVCCKILVWVIIIWRVRVIFAILQLPFTLCFTILRIGHKIH